VGGTGQARRDAVDYFHPNTVLAEPVGFLAAPAEDAWIAAFEAHHALTLARIAQHQPMDKGLRSRAAATAFAYVHDACIGTVFRPPLFSTRGSGY